MNIGGDNSTVEYPLFQTECGGASPASPLQLSDLIYERCARRFAIRLNEMWHSRMPLISSVGIQYAFHARCGDRSVAVALWSPPVARMLPNHWLELRRFACSPEMPKNGATQFLNWMVRWFRKHCPQRFACISYQDTAVHSGTIYKAAGWIADSTSRAGDTWKDKGGRPRFNINGDDTIASAKVRWKCEL